MPILDLNVKEERDISWHKNTKEATSYFASASDYAFFGGYDHGKKCGVVHIGDHHISPGKKAQIRQKRFCLRC